MGPCNSKEDRWQKSDSSPHYDLIVIGGGSGGLSCAREAAKLGKKVAICDFVTPTPFGTTWGLGGTCVNVGCIPKRIMHQASLNREFMKDCAFYGWQLNGEATHDWNTMVEGVQNYIHSLNFGYKMKLNEEKVKYYNGLAEFVDSHTLKLRLKSDEEETITANKIVLSVGGRPRYMQIPGGRPEDGYCITSDDLFSLPNPPGKVLCIGGGYIAVECAGFLVGMGYEVTIMVRSKILREFDSDIAAIISNTLTERGVQVLPGWIPIEITEGGNSGQLKVTSLHNETKTQLEDTFDTIIMAIGRDPCTPGLNLDKAGVQVDEKSGRIIVDDYDRTNVCNIFAIGDCANGRPELTPPAIRAGHLLARRLFGGSKEKMNYHNIPTTVFSPVEYGSVGMSENAAIEKYGKEGIEVYHREATPLEYVLPNRDKDLIYAKLICLKSKKKEKVVGLHYLGPYAGEVTQGFGMVMQFSPCKSDFDNAVGIHPTCAEIFTDLTITKSSGISFKKTGC